MCTMNVDEMKKALSPLGSTLIKYDEKRDSYTFKRLFFKALGHMKPSDLANKIKARLPSATIIQIWIQCNERDRMSGYECIEVKI